MGNRGLSTRQPQSVGPTCHARYAWSLQDAKGWRCRLCVVCRAGLAGVNHVRGLANEPWSSGCRVTLTSLPQLLLVLSPGCSSAHQSQQQDSSPGVPAIPRWPQCWVTSTGWETQRRLKNEAGGSGEGCAVRLALGTTYLCLSVFTGDRERHRGQEGFGSVPTGSPYVFEGARWVQPCL